MLIWGVRMKTMYWLLTLIGLGTALANSLPLGDQKISPAPRRGYVYSCLTSFPGGGGADQAGPWINLGAKLWSPGAKPTVEGRVRWPGAAINVSVEGDVRIIRSNNLPLHPTGTFPVRPGSVAYRYDRNPNHIGPQPILLMLPAQPGLAANPGCLPMGMIGFALDGVAIYGAFDLAGRDAPAYEIQDLCHGHPERSSQYHYHDWSPCIPDRGGASGRQSSVVGFALDGFPIVGLRGPTGRVTTNADLDECHGRFGNLLINGRRIDTYYYQFTKEYPYVLGCFRGEVAPELLQPSPPQGQPSQGQPPQGKPPQGPPPAPGQGPPPQQP
jgi:YHYH protein